MAVDLQKLKRKMRGVISTRQVTKALQMVSAMKMRKAQEMAARSRLYREQLGNLLKTFDLAPADAVPELAASGSGDRILVVTFGSDRGLCGPYNTNILSAVARIAIEMDPDKLDLKCIGWKVGATLARRRYNVLSNVRRPHPNDRPAFLKQLSAELSTLWQSGNYQAIHLLYSSLRGMTVLKPDSSPWLPVPTEDHSSSRGHAARGAGFIDEPSAREVYAAAIHRHLNNALVAAILDSEASEHVARMVAMDNATRNAQEIYDSLKLTFNKARQAKITQEICEIVAGANAIGKG